MLHIKFQTFICMKGNALTRPHEIYEKLNLNSYDLNS